MYTNFVWLWFGVCALYQLRVVLCAQRTPIADFLPLLNPQRLENDEVYQRVLDRLLNKSNDKPYDGRVRPNATDVEHPTRIVTSIYIRDISQVDEINFQFTVDMDLFQTWEDRRLAFGGKTLAKQNASFLVARGSLADQIWVPDVYFPNEKSGEFHDIIRKNVQTRIYSNGTIVYIVRLQMIFSCHMQLQKYPMDVQTCKIMLSSFSYMTKDVKFEWMEPEDKAIIIAPAEQLNMPKFALLTSYARARTLDSKTSEGTYSCLEAYIRLKREYGFHVIQTYIPTVLLVVASWMSFWIDHKAVPARIAIGVTTLLTIITMTTAVRLGLPPVSYVKGIDVWMFCCIFYIFAALIEFAIMNHAMQTYERGENMLPSLAQICSKKKRPRKKNRVSVVYKQNEEMYKMESSSTITITSGDSEKPIRPSGTKKPKTPIYMKIDQIARFAFPTTFILFLILYFSIYTYDDSQ